MENNDANQTISTNNQIPAKDQTFSSEQTPVKPEKNTWLVPLLLVIILLLLGSTSFFAYHYFQSNTSDTDSKVTNNESITTPTESPLNTSSPESDAYDQTSDWETYTDEKLNIKFRYPSSWVAENYKLQGITLSIAVNPDPLTLSFDTEPEALIRIHVEEGNGNEVKELNSIVGYEDFKQMTVGVDQNIVAYRDNGESIYRLDPSKREFKYYIPHEEYFITISYHVDNSELYKSEFDQILSTLEFTNSPNSTNQSLDDQMILEAADQIFQKEYPNYEVVVGDIEELNFPDNAIVISTKDLEVDGDWGFGKALPPKNLILYIARKSNNTWEVVPENTEQYSNWFQQLPNTLVSQETKDFYQE